MPRPEKGKKTRQRGLDYLEKYRLGVGGGGDYTPLKVHKNENYFGSDFEFCTTAALLVMLKY